MKGMYAQTLVLVIALAFMLWLSLKVATGLQTPAETEACNMWEYILSMIPIVKHFVGSC